MLQQLKRLWSLQKRDYAIYVPVVLGLYLFGVVLLSLILRFSEEDVYKRQLVELDYQELLQEAHRAKLQAVAQQEQLHSDLIEYYTLWGHQIKTPIAALDLLLQTGGGAQSEACACLLYTSRCV